MPFLSPAATYIARNTWFSSWSRTTRPGRLPGVICPRPGTVVEAQLRGPGGDPTAYVIRGALIAIRKDQANLIHVAPPGSEAS